jgi:hypothetical protein
MGSPAHILHSSSRLPPTSPQSRLRSPAHYPVNLGSAAHNRRCFGVPPSQRSPARQLSTRSRSLDGLLDDPTPEAPCQAEETQLLRECEQYLSAQELDSETGPRDSDVPVNEAQDAVSTGSSGEVRAEISKGSHLSLPLPSTGEPKRKRNFMDRCVNKVRSLIRK